MDDEATIPDAIPPGLLAKDDRIGIADNDMEDLVVVEPSTKRPRACHDADLTENRATGEEAVDDSADESRFKMLPFYGEHKRAVSSLAFAPTSSSSSSSLTHGAGAMSYNSNAIQVPILCASASADGCAKVWDLTQSMNSTLLSSSSSSEIISGTVSNTASTKLDPKISLIGHSRGINGEFRRFLIIVLSKSHI